MAEAPLQIAPAQLLPSSFVRGSHSNHGTISQRLYGRPERANHLPWGLARDCRLLRTFARLSTTAFLWVVFCASASAHSFLPVQLVLQEMAPNRWVARWSSAAQATPSALQVAFPPWCTPRIVALPEVARIACRGPGLTEATLRFSWPEASRPELWVRAEFSDGKQVAGPVEPEDAEFFLFHPDRLSLQRLVLRYGRLGVEHILEGWDHLLFLVGVSLGVATVRSMALAITAFTLGHSLSLATSVLTALRFSQPTVEILIALSLVLVARERFFGNPAQDTTIRNVALTFAFGLVHGLGFASALTELGVPERALGWALGSFNVGVELGQLTFVVAALPCMRWWQRRTPFPLGQRLPALAVGSAGAWWTLERLIASWQG